MCCFLLFTVVFTSCLVNKDVHLTLDTLLYVRWRRCDTSTAVDRLKECITEVGQWMSANRLKLNADKTELLWAGSKHGLAYSFGSNRPSLRLGADTVTASEHACLLGVMISSDLSLEKHVDTVCWTLFQVLLLASPAEKSSAITGCGVDEDSCTRFRYITCGLWQHNPCWCTKERHCSPARIVTGTSKYDRGLSHLLHTELHWLDVLERVSYKLALMVHRCLQDKAPQCLSNYCVPVSEVASRQQLRSASRH